ncbi:MAG: translation initiation factor IF-3 [Candidatus Moranbacteria bacterium]|nr:translation initiation factor IF-3 [Candidatus Moranbacteria bacterium]
MSYGLQEHIRRGIRKRPVIKKAPRDRVNEQIRAFQIRLIDESGKQLGVMAPMEALQIAREQELDLVEVAPNAQPPVCRIIDYGKYQYQQSKQERTSKSKQKKVDLKGIRIGLKTDDHDLDFKKNQAEKFLSKGNKVKIEILLRGREKAHQDLARQNLAEFIQLIKFPHISEQEIKRFPGGFNTIIVPQ